MCPAFVHSLNPKLNPVVRDYRFGYDSKRVKGLVDFQLYCDDLAKCTGSLPPLREIFFTKPRLW